MTQENNAKYLVVDADDMHHVCYVADDLGVAVVQASAGLHLYAPVGKHNDDVAVHRFALAMREKLAKARDKGRGGWEDPEQCDAEYLARLLVEHLGKGNDGNLQDVANFAMMLHQRGAHPAILARAFHNAAPAHTMRLQRLDGVYVTVPYQEDMMAFQYKGHTIRNPLRSLSGQEWVPATSYGFNAYHTGGGCMALRKDLPGGFYLLLTDEGGSDIPSDPEDADGATLGLYNADGDELASMTLGNLTQ